MGDGIAEDARAQWIEQVHRRKTAANVKANYKCEFLDVCWNIENNSFNSSITVSWGTIPEKKLKVALASESVSEAVSLPCSSPENAVEMSFWSYMLDQDGFNLWDNEKW